MTKATAQRGSTLPAEATPSLRMESPSMDAKESQSGSSSALHEAFVACSLLQEDVASTLCMLCGTMYRRSRSTAIANPPRTKSDDGQCGQSLVDLLRTDFTLTRKMGQVGRNLPFDTAQTSQLVVYFALQVCIGVLVFPVALCPHMRRSGHEEVRERSGEMQCTLRC